MKGRNLAALCVGLALMVALPSVVDAEAPRTRLTSTQKKLTEKAFAAYKAGDFDKAVTLFRSSLELGPNNITYLHLGRALFRAGKCDEAVAAYNTVNKAPQVRKPSPAAVLAKLADYRGEVEGGCPGEARFTCNPTSLQLSIDGGEPMECEGLALSLKSGEHVASTEVLGEIVEKRFQITGTMTHDIAVAVSASDLLARARTIAEPRDRLPYLSLAVEVENPAEAWLLLATTQLELGQCGLAVEALEKMDGAATSAALSASAARTEREMMATRLGEACYGAVTATCTEDGMMLRVDDGEPVPCDGTTARLLVGNHQISAMLGDRMVSKTIEVTAGSAQTVELGLKARGGDTHWEWWTLGAGVAVLAGWAAYDAFVLTPTFDDYEAAAAAGDADQYDKLQGDFNSQRTLSLGLFAAGMVATLTGAIFVGLDLIEAEDAEAVQLWIDPRGTGIVWGASW